MDSRPEDMNMESLEITHVMNLKILLFVITAHPTVSVSSAIAITDVIGV